MSGSITLGNVPSLFYFWPETILVLGAIAVLLVDLLGKRPSRKTSGAIALVALGGSIVATLVTGDETARGLFGGLIARDGFADFFKVLSALVGMVVGVIAMRSRDTIEYREGRVDRDREAGEFYALALTVCLGINLMAASTDMLMAYLSLEMVSVMSYILAGYTNHSRRSAEASLKYVIYGGVASGVMLYGLSILYGIAGTTDLAAIGAAARTANPTAVVVAFSLCMAGFGYKIASVPFHMWCPDVYEGAPTPVSAFLSVGPKAAGFALLIRFMGGAIPPELAEPGKLMPSAPWELVLAAVSVATMTLGNLAAISQQNIKRMLAYSSIAHAGYLLMGVAAGTMGGYGAVMFYLFAYLFMNLGAFLVVIAVADAGLGENVSDYQGLGYRAPLVAAVLAVFLISLTGLPPMFGFVGKFYLFREVIAKGGTILVVLAIIGVLNSAVSLYYYARLLKVMYLDKAAEGAGPVVVARQHTALLVPLAAFTIFFGLYFKPVYAWVEQSMQLWAPAAAQLASIIR